MKKLSHFNSPLSGPLRLSLCVLLLTVAAAVGQSGRRTGTGTPGTPPAPETKKAENKTVPAEQPRQDLIIAIDRSELIAKIPLYLYDSVLLSCSRRLDDSRSVRVEVVSKDTSRAEAVNRAKSQKEAYVVWLQLRTDGISDNDSPSALHIDYTILEPVTAKVRTQGRCYQSYDKGSVIAPRTSGTNNSALVERRLKDSAREAAERVLKALNIALPADAPDH